MRRSLTTHLSARVRFEEILKNLAHPQSENRVVHKPGVNIYVCTCVLARMCLGLIVFVHVRASSCAGVCARSCASMLFAPCQRFFAWEWLSGLFARE